MRKIAIVTGTRAEYGLLYWLIKEVHADPELELLLIVTGTHLSPEFGLTHKKIEEDGFTNFKKIEILMSSDTAVGVTKSMGLALISFGEMFEWAKPDILVILGDRFEMLAIASAALIAKVPIAHIGGGETTKGAFDESIRHSITKLSHLHLTSTDKHQKRVMQLGESPSRVFNVGALGVESIRKLPLLPLDDLEKKIDFKLGENCLLVTYHPVTLGLENAETQFQSLLSAIDSFPEIRVIFTKSNADTQGRAINKMIDDFTRKNKNKVKAFTSMGQLLYLSTMKYAFAVVGNSSSGLIEAPSFKVSTINIGDRQKGRPKAQSVIDCASTKEAIVQSLKKIKTKEFQETLKEAVNPFEKENTTETIKGIIKKFELKGVTQKDFYDVPVNHQ